MLTNWPPPLTWRWHCLFNLFSGLPLFSFFPTQETQTYTSQSPTHKKWNMLSNIFSFIASSLLSLDIVLEPKNTFDLTEARTHCPGRTQHEHTNVQSWGQRPLGDPWKQPLEVKIALLNLLFGPTAVCVSDPAFRLVFVVHPFARLANVFLNLGPRL